jgi:prefoldin subunit 5
MKDNNHRIWQKRQQKVNTNTSQNTSKTSDDDVMISTSIKDLEAMMEGVETHTKTSFEKMFLPAIIVFALLAFGGFVIIYSITTDMTRLASAMDPKMAQNMSSMTKSIDNLSKNVSAMTMSVKNMDNNFSQVNEKMSLVAEKMQKLDNLDEISADLDGIQDKLTALKPMLNNMNHMNSNMKSMDSTMKGMGDDIRKLRNDFGKPMGIINSMPFM